MQYAYETLKKIVLTVLAGRRMYGYEITQEAKLLNKGEVQITEGALYPILHVMEKEGVLKTETEITGWRRRKYYIPDKKNKTKINQKGKATLII